MNKRVEENHNFQKSLGAFIIAFSEVEFALADLSSMTEDDLLMHKSYLAKHLGLSLDKKLNNISKFIKNHLPELQHTWDEQKTKISTINKDRRYLAHGFTQYFIPFEDGIVTTYLRKKNGKDSFMIEKKEFTSKILSELTNQLHHIKSGKNGIYGEFNTMFTKLRIDKWNQNVSVEKKIIYNLNNEIISEWKGDIEK